MKNIESGEIALKFEFIPLKGLEQATTKQTRGSNGVVQIDLLRAESLLAVDGGGTSDPFCIIKLDGQRVFKSKVIKKTTAPIWNESFEVDLESPLSNNLNRTKRLEPSELLRPPGLSLNRWV